MPDPCRSPASAAPPPGCGRAAVVVPSHGRPEALRGCLESLMALDGAPEIVVVDDGSPAPLTPVCAGFGERVRCIRQANAGPGAARNTGVAAVTAPFLAFTDDDCRPVPGWLAALRAAEAGDPARLVGGPIVNALTDNPYAAASQSIASHLHAEGIARDGAPPYLSTNNLGLSRARFEALGGFDPRYRFASEDRDFCRRWRAAGGRLVHAPRAVVHHHHPLTLAGFWRQQLRYGRGARQYHGGGAPGGGPRLAAAGRYLRLLAHPLADGAPRPLTRAMLVALSQAAILAGYLLGPER
ncbi:hypothetical protein LNKW23_09840 [Paralimibaculum aggregatum]|uniref:Glycosyltransferase 2-like domain-containing protein n=1 Tax=Paralimibaculum aggregatum TaxID=3036245 RepID=A0ABQ6LMU9_9RHOB|nr:glycosyltransferase [Limibaculum sp. NKW23]GMG81771.1 hypothetical protein LNKW23_09840 [Limibaculum sp. NKW23]